MKKIFLISSLYLLWQSFEPFLHVLSVDTKEISTSLCFPSSGKRREPLSLLFSKADKPKVLGHPSQDVPYSSVTSKSKEQRRSEREEELVRSRFWLRVSGMTGQILIVQTMTRHHFGMHCWAWAKTSPRILLPAQILAHDCQHWPSLVLPSHNFSTVRRQKWDFSTLTCCSTRSTHHTQHNSAGWISEMNPGDNQQSRHRGGIHGNSAFFLVKKGQKLRRRKKMFITLSKMNTGVLKSNEERPKLPLWVLESNPFHIYYYIIILVTWLNGFCLQSLALRTQLSYYGGRHQVSPCHSGGDPIPSLHGIINFLSKHSPEMKLGCDPHIKF